MDSLNLINALQSRDVSFLSFRNALKNLELPVSTGWFQTVEKLTPGLKSADTATEYSKAIINIHNNLTLYCDKVVKIFNIDPDILTALAAAMSADFIEDSPYSKAFPIPLGREELIAAPLEVSCVDLWKGDAHYNFMMCSKQYITEREEIPGEHLAEDAKKDFGVFDELIGIRRKPIQLYDIVSIHPNSSQLHIRLDGVKKFNSEDTSKRMRRIEQIISKYAKEKLGIDKVLSSAVNFFPAIRKLYNSDDGVVGELGHLTDASGIYKEKMRQKSRDVRKDPYHHGGTEAVCDLNPFSISKHWPSPNGYGNPEASIPAHFSIASIQSPVIDLLHVLSCTTEEDYNFVLSKVI